MKHTIAVSVIIPAFNEENYIRKSLQSILAQDFPHPFEVIIVDNNSTDNTKQIIASFNDHRVRCVSEKKQGVVFARQAGLQVAEGEIIAGADSDSTYPRTWLTRLYSHFKNKDIVAVGGPSIPDSKPWWMFLMHRYGFSLIDTVYQLTGYVMYLTANNFAYRRNVFMASGGYDTSLGLGGGDEIDAVARLRKLGTVVFDRKLTNRISSRRYRVGFFRFVFVHSLYYYWLNYFVSKFIRKRFIYVKAVRE